MRREFTRFLMDAIARTLCDAIEQTAPGENPMLSASREIGGLVSDDRAEITISYMQPSNEALSWNRKALGGRRMSARDVTALERRMQAFAEGESIEMARDDNGDGSMTFTFSLPLSRKISGEIELEVCSNVGEIHLRSFEAVVTFTPADAIGTVPTPQQASAECAKLADVAKLILLTAERAAQAA